MRGTRWEEKKSEVGDELIFLLRVLLELLPRLVTILDMKIVFTVIGDAYTQAASCHLLLQKGGSFERREWRKCFCFKIRAVEITGW